MLSALFEQFRRHHALADVRAAVARGETVSVHGLGGSSPVFAAAALLDGRNRSGRRVIVAVLPDEDAAESFRDDLEAVIGHDRVAFFPERDTAPYEHADSHFEVRSQRMETLDRLEHGWSGVVAASAGALHDPTTPPGLITLVSMNLARGMRIGFDDLVRSLVAKGFQRSSTVTAAGEIAVRGGIVDLFPFGGELPYRIEFWGDEIESVRTFSTGTQRSIDEVEGFRIIPPDEFVTEAGIDAPDERRMADIGQRYGIDLHRIVSAVGGGERPGGIEQYLHVVFGARASLLSYLGGDDAVLLMDSHSCRHALDNRIKHSRTIWERQRSDDPDLPPPDVFYESPDDLMTRLSGLPLVEMHDVRLHGVPMVEFGILPVRQYQGDLSEVRHDISTVAGAGISTYIACDNQGQADRLAELLDEIEGFYAAEIARISGGFHAPAADLLLLTDHEIFGRHSRRTRYRKYKEGVPIPDHRALTLGDFVVHVDYGIGKFMGLKRITAGGVETDCLLVQYRGNDTLYVPVDQLKRLKKFSAEEGIAPVVSQLGGTAWERLKERTKKSIERMAKDLLRLYAERKMIAGHQFVADEHMLRALEESFVFEETPDQTRAWADVRRDMESPAPMDRLICGDVGFGKTEIAIRAAFLAVLGGKTAAVLAPTTILAEQHGETFSERLADFPVKVETISRFKSQKEQKDILDRLAAGQIDIIIGTHRLLSGDVYIRNLGLLIIDEEQQFGVRHKERLKSFRSSIDILSMSATPIPRTLNMSLLGARDVSFINTPPPDRLSVHTEVVPFEEKYVIEAVMREIDRDGQVFFVHNRVRTIESMANYLRRLMPNVTFGVAHGQMPEHHLEKIMEAFYHRKYQVLVSTMIIENGLDIPSVNTIVISRADTFGLAQLYQLRGRVGRSSVRAFAYLLVPPRVPISKIAQKRLRTIEELAALGSGFSIAMRDLEFRGAGNILGTEQSGFIAAIGFDLYVELLHETIAELRGEKVRKPPDTEVHTTADAYLPEEYISDARERVTFYRRLSETVTVEDVRVLEDELTDRYGRPSAPAANLLATAYIRHYAAALDAGEVRISGKDVTLFVPAGITVSRGQVEALVKRSPVELRFSFDGGMTVMFTVPDDDDNALRSVKKVLQALSG